MSQQARSKRAAGGAGLVPLDTPSQKAAFVADRCRREEKILEAQAERVSRERRRAAAHNGSEEAKDVRARRARHRVVDCVSGAAFCV
jgi:hypothetical protein